MPTLDYHDKIAVLDLGGDENRFSPSKLLRRKNFPSFRGLVIPDGLLCRAFYSTTRRRNAARWERESFHRTG
ncbi:hypothetical protein ACIA5H_25900 [Nocardia sp. NPDC051900]|uniref:hypothetical protein n=1 Tax=Nocardia sp. NPDC051900 TaxID=3364326 RepID=UPI003788FB54